MKRFSLLRAVADRAGRLPPGRHTLTWTFALLGLVIFLFITVPLLKMLLSSVAEPVIFWKTLVDPQVAEAIWLTLYAALIATIVGFILGVPLAYLLARHEFRGKRLVEGLIDVPIVVPHTAAGIALLFVFGRSFAVVILTCHPMIAPVLVFERFEAFGLDSARPVAVLLIIVSVLAFVVLRVLINRDRQA